MYNKAKTWVWDIKYIINLLKKLTWLNFNDGKKLQSYSGVIYPHVTCVGKVWKEKLLQYVEAKN